MRESEERHRLLFDSTPVPMWVCDLKTMRFLAVNQAAVSHYGYSREEFSSMTLREIRPPEDVPGLLERHGKLAPDEQKTITTRHQTKAGAGPPFR